MICVICEREFEGYGNNPEPLEKFENGRCCDSCNDFVKIARMIRVIKNE